MTSDTSPDTGSPPTTNPEASNPEAPGDGPNDQPTDGASGAAPVVRQRRLTPPKSSTGSGTSTATSTTTRTLKPTAPPPPPMAPPASEPADAKPQVGDTRPAPKPQVGDTRSASKPKIGDTRPAPPSSPKADSGSDSGSSAGSSKGQGRSRRRRGRGKGGSQQQEAPAPVEAIIADERPAGRRRRRSGRRSSASNDQALGRNRMLVSVGDEATHVAVLEGRTLLEHYVSRPADDEIEIHGNIYLGKVRRVLPGMEAAFIDLGTNKHAVLYQADLDGLTEDLSDLASADDDSDDQQSGNGGNQKGNASGRRGGGGGGGRNRGPRRRIEQVLKANQAVLCQVNKKPVAHKGARVTTNISLPGRFVVLMPETTTGGISRRIDPRERKRLGAIIREVTPAGFGLIVRTAAQGARSEDIRRDVDRLLNQWQQITELAQKTSAPALLFREPSMAIRLIREEFDSDFRDVIIDDRATCDQVRGYMEAVAPEAADRIQYYDPEQEQLGLLQRHGVATQLTKALDRKVWLPSGGSLIIEHTEALTVIDVNTGKNVGRSSHSETIFENNLEAADEIARQLRLRDIGGIIVIDFVDLDDHGQRDQLLQRFTDALALDKTRTAVEPMSDLGIVHMTRRRIGEGLLETVSHACDVCGGRGLNIDPQLVGSGPQNGS